MPTHIKIMVSIITLLVGAVFYYLEGRYGEAHIANIAAGVKRIHGFGDVDISRSW
jgi:hypothetical protein